MLDTEAQRLVTGFTGSGYYAFKALIWRGIRSYPGMAWFTLFISAPSIVFAFFMIFALIAQRDEQLQHERAKIKYSLGMMGSVFMFYLSIATLYLGLSINTVNDLYITTSLVCAYSAIGLNVAKVQYLSSGDAGNMTLVMTGIIFSVTSLGLVDVDHNFNVCVLVIQVVCIVASFLTSAIMGLSGPLMDDDADKESQQEAWTAMLKYHWVVVIVQNTILYAVAAYLNATLHGTQAAVWTVFAVAATIEITTLLGGHTIANTTAVRALQRNDTRRSQQRANDDAAPDNQVQL